MEIIDRSVVVHGNRTVRRCARDDDARQIQTALAVAVVSGHVDGNRLTLVYRRAVVLTQWFGVVHIVFAQCNRDISPIAIIADAHREAMNVSQRFVIIGRRRRTCFREADVPVRIDLEPAVIVAAANAVGHVCAVDIGRFDRSDHRRL